MYHAVRVRRHRRHHRDTAGVDQVEDSLGTHLCDITDQSDIGLDSIHRRGTPDGREQLRVLTRDPDRIRSVAVDQSDQLAANLTE
ncbi:Uncharacterised protein [Mycobacteroides abscessus subsp. massiliense]|nr:Uncharacterised protein [Mycobacteroides abscessus subsp. massiliense]